MADPISAYISGKSEERAAKSAAASQEAMAREGIAETRRGEAQFREDLKPYTDAGMASINILEPYYAAGLGSVGGLKDIAAGTGLGYQGMQAISGMGGPQAQQEAMARISQSPEFMEQMRQSENAMLQNASATGGLRGGNTQAALAQLRPAMFNQAVDKQYGRYSDMTGMGGDISQFLASSGQNIGTNIFQAGQASAAGTGAAAMQGAGAVTNLFGNIGNARASANLMEGQGLRAANEAHQSTLSQAGSMMGGMMGMSDMKMKIDIKPIEKKDYSKLRGVTWKWKTENGQGTTGVIAQDVQEVLPEAVKEIDGILHVDYGVLCAHLVEALNDV
jgi:hypothetical protein